MATAAAVTSSTGAPAASAQWSCLGSSSGSTAAVLPSAPGSSESQLVEDESLVLVEDVLDDEAPLASGLDIFLVHPSAPSMSSSLSPLTSPFYPGVGSMGRSNARRWVDEDSDTERSPVNSPTSYLDAICQGRSSGCHPY
jgi:hypothetical protein